jgi:ATP-dependent helicase Lhr and Lhr-like helicase
MVKVRARRRIQRIGLSATVGNPGDLMAWLTRNRGGTIVGSGAGPPTGEVLADYVGSVDNAVSVLARVHRGERRLVFADSRARVEELASGLRGAGVGTFVSHGSLSAEERRQAEAAFAAEPDCDRCNVDAGVGDRRWRPRPRNTGRRTTNCR